MSFALPHQTRILALVAIAVALIAAVLVARPLVLSENDTASTPAVTPTPKPAPAPSRSAKPAVRGVQLLPGLPAPLAKRLRYSNVVVVSVYAAKAPTDRTAFAQARAGAREVGAGFVALNVLDERKARSLQTFLGASDSPAVLVVRRPGKIVNRFQGFVDAAIVAQAAQNAGAGKRASK